MECPLFKIAPLSSRAASTAVRLVIRIGYEFFPVPLIQAGAEYLGRQFARGLGSVFHQALVYVHFTARAMRKRRLRFRTGFSVLLFTAQCGGKPGEARVIEESQQSRAA